MTYILLAEHIVRAKYEVEESIDAASFTHGYMQARQVILLGCFAQYTIDQWRPFSRGEVADEKVAIHLSIDEIFA